MNLRPTKLIWRYCPKEPKARTKPKTFMKTNKKYESKGTTFFVCDSAEICEHETRETKSLMSLRVFFGWRWPQLLSIQDTKEIMNIRLQNLMNLGAKNLYEAKSARKYKPKTPDFRSSCCSVASCALLIRCLCCHLLSRVFVLLLFILLLLRHVINKRGPCALERKTPLNFWRTNKWLT